MLTFKFYFSFQTALLYIIEFELPSNPVILVGKVFIISNIQGIFPKETRADRCQSSESKYTAIPTRSGNPSLDCSEDLGLGLEIHILSHSRRPTVMTGVYGITLKNIHPFYTILYLGC